MQCLSDETLARLGDGALSAGERRVVASHVDECAECRQILAALGRARHAENGRGHGGAASLRAVGRYTLERVLGVGAMGVVYAAWDPQLSRRVALKIVRPDRAAEEAGGARLVREARAMARLSHPNVVTVFDAGEVGGDVFVAMDLVEGQTLAQWLRGAPHTWNAIIDVFARAGEGLAAAHEAGLVHRDFKPDNVLFGADGRVCVTDFGLARAARADGADRPAGRSSTADLASSVSAAGLLVGTPAYMAPEQLDGRTCDARADQFSFCVACYEALFGARPFAGTDLATLRASMAAGIIGTPLAAAAPAGVRAVLARGLALDPDARFSTMRELLSALAAAREGASRPPRARAWLAPLVAVLVIAGVAFAAHLGSRASAPSRTRPSVAVVAFEHDARRPDLDWIGRVLADAVAAQLAAGDTVRVVERATDIPFGERRGAPAQDAPSLARIGAELDVEDVVTGSYATDARGGITADVRVMHASSGETRARVSVLGATDDPLDVAEQLASKLRVELGADVATTAEKRRARAALPSSAEAARNYVRGLDLLAASDAKHALDAFADSMRADNAFALSHAYASTAWSQLGYEAHAREEADRATSLAEPLPRDRKLLLSARRSEAYGRFAEAADLYRALVRFYPDDLEYGLRLVHALTASGRAEEALKEIDAIRAGAHRSASDPRLDLAECEAAETAGALEHERDAAARAEGRGEKANAPLLVARARLWRASALRRLGDLERAESLATDALHACEAAGDEPGVLQARTVLAAAQTDRGALATAAGEYERCVEEAETLGDRAGTMRALQQLSAVERAQGRMAVAREHLERTLRIAREVSAGASEASVLAALANLLCDVGDFAEAERTYEAAITRHRELGNEAARANVQVELAFFKLERGAPARADQLAREAVETLRDFGDQRALARALERLGDTRLESGDLTGAEQAFREALELREDVGPPQLLAASRIATARLEIEQGRFADAEKMARRALEQQDAEAGKDPRMYFASILARALLQQGKRTEARALVASFDVTDGERAGWYVRMVAAMVAGAEADRADRALAEVDAVIDEARQRGARRPELWARHVRASIELPLRRPGARQRALALEEDAARTGYALIAQRTAAIRVGRLVIPPESRLAAPR